MRPIDTITTRYCQVALHTELAAAGIAPVRSRPNPLLAPIAVPRDHRQRRYFTQRR